jgi:hypothetical protein
MNTVQIFLRKAENKVVFNIALQELMEKNSKITPAFIQGSKTKGDDVLVTIEEPYKLQADLLEAKTLHTQDIKEITLALIKNPLAHPIISLDVNLESKAMNDSTDNSRKIENKDGNVIGNILGDEGTISGTVAHTINQLPDEPKGDKPSLKEILTQLQQAIETDPQITPDQKAKFLKQLQNLATAGKDTKSGAMQEMADEALTMLKGIMTSLPSAAAALKACNELLPAISSLFCL